ncbi:MAG TPA: hypothetical protein VLB69_12855 [Rudaea sp.]|nr:hypothetical protein [Rudaea sp.]
MTAKVLLAPLLALVCLMPVAGVAQPADAKLSVSRNAAGDVLIKVSATIPACGLTALNEAPTFAIEGTSIKVRQPIVGIACINPPPKDKHYERVLNVGKLGQGRYTIEWSFPAVTGTYSSPGS